METMVFGTMMSEGKPELGSSKLLNKGFVKKAARVALRQVDLPRALGPNGADQSAMHQIRHKHRARDLKNRAMWDWVGSKLSTSIATTKLTGSYGGVGR